MRMGRTCHCRYRHWHDAGAIGETVPGFHSGRFLDRTALRRDGARTCDLAQARAHDGRRRDRRKRSGEGIGLYSPPTGRARHALTLLGLCAAKRRALRPYLAGKTARCYPRIGPPIAARPAPSVAEHPGVRRAGSQRRGSRAGFGQGSRTAGQQAWPSSQATVEVEGTLFRRTALTGRAPPRHVRWPSSELGRRHLSRVPFSQRCSKIDNKRLFEERICQVHVHRRQLL
jgi:hypothetical protein